ncbi:MAG: hypothetical protein AAGC55_31945, partial [Myxococcota bacterium]
GGDTGTGELCLTSRRASGSCTYCKPIEITAQGAGDAREPDFTMTGCSSYPPRRSPWTFAVAEAKADTLYEWKVSGQAMVYNNSLRQNPVQVKPKLRPGQFTVEVTASDGSGKRASYAQTFHNVYSCPRSFSP